MTVLQPAKSNQKHPPQSAGVFIATVSVACLAVGLCLGLNLRGLNTTPLHNNTYWQEKASTHTHKPVIVTYETHYTTPESRALKAEMDTFRANFTRYRTTKAALKKEIFAGSDKENTTKATHVQNQSTSALAAKITRTLLLDEVDSFLNKVQLVEEVRQHAQEVGF